MSTHFRRAVIAFASLLALAALARGQSAAPLAPAPVQTTPAAGVEPQDSTDAKLAIVLRSYTLLQEENDQLKAAQEKLATEKAALEAQLAVAKNALPLADQAAALHEQLRQTQDQLAALATENNQLKTRLALGAGSQGSGSVMASPTYPGTPAATAATTPAPAKSAPPPAAAPRTHVIVAGDTLAKISTLYYGTPSRWPDILAANRDVLRDEKSLVVGRSLRIP